MTDPKAGTPEGQKIVDQLKASNNSLKAIRSGKTDSYGKGKK